MNNLTNRITDHPKSVFEEQDGSLKYKIIDDNFASLWRKLNEIPKSLSQTTVSNRQQPKAQTSNSSNANLITGIIRHYQSLIGFKYDKDVIVVTNGYPTTISFYLGGNQIVVFTLAYNSEWQLTKVSNNLNSEAINLLYSDEGYLTGSQRA